MDVPGQEGPGVVYDTGTRKKLVLMGAPEYRQFAVLRGRLTGVDFQKHNCTLNVVNGDRVQIDYTADFAQTVYEALDQTNVRKVIVRGFVLFNPNDQPTKVEKIVHLETLDPNDVPARVEEFTLLKDGWLDGYGTAPDPAALRWLIDIWEKGYPDDLPKPFAYPTPEGGVQLEWTFGPWELSANVDLAKKRAALSGVRVDAEESVDSEVELAAPAGWKTLADFVRTACGDCSKNDMRICSQSNRKQH